MEEEEEEKKLKSYMIHAPTDVKYQVWIECLFDNISYSFLFLSIFFFFFFFFFARRMDLIGSLPEVVLPHLCSFFTLEMNGVMAQVNKNWKRVADTYGSLGTFLSLFRYSFSLLFFSSVVFYYLSSILN